MGLPLSVSFKYIRMLVTLVCISSFVMLLPSTSAAQYNPTNVVGNFSCAGSVAAPGMRIFTNSNFALDTNGNCIDSATGFFGIFSTLICKYETTLYQVMSNMFCSLSAIAVRPIQLVLTFFLILFAVSFMFGVVEFTAKEAMLHILKFALVLTFAFQAEFVIGMAYAFFVRGTQDGILLAISNLTRYNTATSTTSNAGIASLNALTQGSLLEWFANLNPLLLGFLIALMILFFPIGAFILSMIIQFLLVIVRAITGYLLAITMLTFLIVLMPIFLCFGLFKTTAYFFENWLHNLISFTLQMIILFTVMSLMNVIDLGNYFQYLADLIKRYTYTIKLWIFEFPMTGLSICRYAYPSRTGPNELVYPGGYNTVVHPDADTMRPLCGYVNADPRLLPEPYLTEEQWIAANPSYILTDADMIPFFHLFLQKELMGNILVNVITLIILGQLLETFLRLVPDIARLLAGKMYAGKLGGMTATTVKVSAGSIHMSGAKTFQLAREGFVSGAAKVHGFGHMKMRGGLLGAIDAAVGLKRAYSSSQDRSKRTNIALYSELMSEAANLGQSPYDIQERNNPYKDALGMSYGGVDPRELKMDSSGKMTRKYKHVLRNNERPAWYFYMSESPHGKWDGKV